MRFLLLLLVLLRFLCGSATEGSLRDELLLDEGSTCYNGKCVKENSGGIRTPCRPGFAEYKGQCKECKCGEKYNCTFSPGLFSDGKECICPSAYGDKNGKCTEIEPCYPNPCKNGGTCRPKGANYTCICDNMHTGKNCEIEIEPCYPNPCKNGGTCRPKGANYTCICDYMHKGKNCKTEIKPCDSNPCKNGGTCVPKGENYTCVCDDRHKGNNCEMVNDSCNPNPCLNGGTCLPMNSSYRCRCDDQHTGFNCETNVESQVLFQIEENVLQEREKTEEKLGGIISRLREMNYTNHNLLMRILSPKRKKIMGL